MNNIEVSRNSNKSFDSMQLHPSDTDEAFSVYQSMLRQLLRLQHDLKKRTHYLKTAEQAIDESISNINRKLGIVRDRKNSRDIALSRIKDMLLNKE